MKKGLDCIGVSVVYFCHDGQGNVLMAKRSSNAQDDQEVWDFGGGGVELGDNVEETLIKEIKEEYCAEVLEFEFLGFRDVHRTLNSQKTHWISLDYKVLVDPKKVRIGEPEKFDDIGWFKLDELPKEIHSQAPTFLNNYRDKLKI